MRISIERMRCVEWNGTYWMDMLYFIGATMCEDEYTDAACAEREEWRNYVVFGMESRVEMDVGTICMRRNSWKRKVCRPDVL